MSLEDSRLIDRAMRGDQKAIQILVRRLMPILYARVRASFGRSAVGTHGVEDLVQEIWMILIRDSGAVLRAYDPSRGASLEGYVGMIARREVGNRRQHAAATKRGAHLTVAADQNLTALSDDAPTPEESAEARDLVRRLGAHFCGALPERGWVVLQYAFVDGMPAPEVARAMGVNVQVVYNWQHKIRELARTFAYG